MLCFCYLFCNSFLTTLKPTCVKNVIIVFVRDYCPCDKLGGGFRRMFFGVNLRQLVFATLMGSLASSVRNLGIYVIVYPPFKIDPRWVFSLLGACWTGPVGGLICGTLAAMKLPYPMIDLAGIPVHVIIGLTSRWLISCKRNYLYACFLWPIFGVPLYWLATLLVAPAIATIALIPILLFIGVSGAVLAFVVGLAVEKRARSLLNLFGV